jgi:signal transduction histidine kinase/PAS domain-containing protein
VTGPFKILLISHDTQLGVAVRAALRVAADDAFDLVLAEDLEVATGLLGQQQPAVILLHATTEADVSLLQSLSVSFAVPIIVLVESSAEVTGWQALTQGAEDFLSIDHLHSDQLSHAIKRALISRQGTAQRRQDAHDCRACDAPMGKIIATNADGMVIVDRHGAVQFANPAAEALFGRSLEALMGQPFGFPLVAGESIELDVRHNGGAPAVVEMRVVEIPWEGRKAFLATLRDVTKRKHMEAALRNLVEGTAPVTGQDFFRVLVRHLAQALDVRYAFVGELAGPGRDAIRTTAVWAGTGYRDNFEYGLAGTPCEKVVGAELRSYVQDLPLLFPQDPRLAELGAQSYMGVPLYDSSHTPLGVLGILHDSPLKDTSLAESIVSIFAARASAELERQGTEERAQMHQAELAHVSRISTMGELATGIAHELNQPLTAIGTFADVAKRMLHSPSPAMQDMSEIIDDIATQAIRAGEIIRRLRQFVTKHPPEKRDVNVNGLVEAVAGFMEADFRKHKVELHLELDESLPVVSADVIQIEQVVLNLMRNAVEAMHEAESDPRQLTIHTGPASGNDVRVVISDTGPGMDQEMLTRIFEPFVSTKSQGIGVGLSISCSIIERHGGRLWAESMPGRGAVFSFKLPVSAS